MRKRDGMKKTKTVVLRNIFSRKINGTLYLLTLALLFILSGCGAEKPDRVLGEISEMLGVDVSAGEVISESDSHGGFHGDGDTVIEIRFSDTAFSEEIEEKEEWNALPLTENLTVLVYGVHSGNSSAGPMIHNGDGIPVIPKVESGYYYFRDRHSQSTDPRDDSKVLGRASYNFTIAIFDTGRQTLYYMELDT